MVKTTPIHCEMIARHESAAWNRDRLINSLQIQDPLVDARIVIGLSELQNDGNSLKLTPLTHVCSMLWKRWESIFLQELLPMSELSEWIFEFKTSSKFHRANGRSIEYREGWDFQSQFWSHMPLSPLYHAPQVDTFVVSQEGHDDWGAELPPRILGSVVHHNGSEWASSWL